MPPKATPPQKRPIVLLRPHTEEYTEKMADTLPVLAEMGYDALASESIKKKIGFTEATACMSFVEYMHSLNVLKEEDKLDFSMRKITEIDQLAITGKADNNILLSPPPDYRTFETLADQHFTTVVNSDFSIKEAYEAGIENFYQQQKDGTLPQNPDLEGIQTITPLSLKQEGQPFFLGIKYADDKKLTFEIGEGTEAIFQYLKYTNPSIAACDDVIKEFFSQDPKRNEHMAATVSSLMQEGKNVVAECGSAHAVAFKDLSPVYISFSSSKVQHEIDDVTVIPDSKYYEKIKEQCDASDKDFLMLDVDQLTTEQIQDQVAKTLRAANPEHSPAAATHASLVGKKAPIATEPTNEQMHQTFGNFIELADNISTEATTKVPDNFVKWAKECKVFFETKAKENPKDFVSTGGFEKLKNIFGKAWQSVEEAAKSLPAPDPDDTDRADMLEDFKSQLKSQGLIAGNEQQR